MNSLKRKLLCLSFSAIVSTMLAQHAMASSHREAPYITKLPQVDGSDFYSFMSYESGRENYVTFLANYLPLQASYGGPNYFSLDPNAIYEIHIDNDGDAQEDLTFQFDFRATLVPTNIEVGATGDSSEAKSNPSPLKNIGVLSRDTEAGLSHLESYKIMLIEGDRRRGSKSAISLASDANVTSFRKPHDYAGTKTFGAPGQYSEYANSFIYEVNIPNCSAPGRVFVGQRYEAFKLALGEIFDLVNLVPIEGASPQDENRNALIKNNVTSLAVEVHKDCVVGDGNGTIGSWTSSSIRQVTIQNRNPTFNKPELAGGGFVQVSRLGMPLVNELVIGYPDKDRFNSSEPKDDTQFSDYVTHPTLPVIIDSLFREPLGVADNIAPQNYPRQDLVTAFLTGFGGVNQLKNITPSEMQRLNTNIPPTLRAEQHPLGVAAGDLAGYPNGRRPGDDVVDISLRVVMGVLCHDLPLSPEGVNLGLCQPEDATVGEVAFTDFAPLSARDLNNSFPYLLTPYPGAPFDAPLPKPSAE